MDKQEWTNKVVQFLEDLISDDKRLENRSVDDRARLGIEWFDSYSHYAKGYLLDIPDEMFDNLSEHSKARFQKLVDTGTIED